MGRFTGMPTVPPHPPADDVLAEVERILTAASRRGPFGLRTGPGGWAALALAALAVTCSAPIWWWPAGAVAFLVAVLATERFAHVTRFAVAHRVEQLRTRLVPPADAPGAAEAHQRLALGVVACAVGAYVLWLTAPVVLLVAALVGLIVFFTAATSR